ncbi:unnamed protein product [Durusdinium trenchii]|uniref:Uncharacterized protein n=2 Tax=Durusdinium trenchii TaxID=1381693 RepID=A0ABP0IS82_9DINO
MLTLGYFILASAALVLAVFGDNFEDIDVLQFKLIRSSITIQDSSDDWTRAGMISLESFEDVGSCYSCRGQKSLTTVLSRSSTPLRAECWHHLHRRSWSRSSCCLSSTTLPQRKTDKGFCQQQEAVRPSSLSSSTHQSAAKMSVGKELAEVHSVGNQHPCSWPTQEAPHSAEDSCCELAQWHRPDQYSALPHH